MTREERIAKEKQEKGLFYHHEEDPWDYFGTDFGLEDYIEYGIIVLSDLEKFRNGTGVSSGHTVDVTIEQAREWGFLDRKTTAANMDSVLPTSDDIL